MIHITKTDTQLHYEVIHTELPEAIATRRFKVLSTLLGKHDPSLPTLALLNNELIEPFEPLPIDSVGMLHVTFEGIPYVTLLG